MFHCATCTRRIVIGYLLIGLAIGRGLAAQDIAGQPIVEALRPEPFPIFPWDQMRHIDGPADRVHGSASLVECNFTFAGFPRVEDLKACERLALKAIVYPDPSLDLTKRHHHLSDEQIEHAISTLAQQTKDSPACVGFFILDEPGATEFADLGKIVAAVRRHAPGKLAYINLLPSYATAGLPGKSQLEAKNYTEYLERYVAEVKPQFLSYDNYMVQLSKDLTDPKRAAIYFRDLIEVRRVSLEHNLPFWNIVAGLQIRSEASPPSPANLLLQGWTTLAAGGSGVSWFKYKQQKEYNYAPIDLQHRPGLTWNYLQMVNRQLKVIGPIVSRLKSEGVYFTSPAPLANGPKLPGKLVKTLEADAPVMIGEFASQGETVDHVVLVNLSLQRTTTVRMKELLSQGKLETYSAEDGHLDKCEPELALTAGQGVLLKLSR